MPGTGAWLDVQWVFTSLLLLAAALDTTKASSYPTNSTLEVTQTCDERSSTCSQISLPTNSYRHDDDNLSRECPLANELGSSVFSIPACNSTHSTIDWLEDFQTFRVVPGSVTEVKRLIIRLFQLFFFDQLSILGVWRWLQAAVHIVVHN